MVDYQGETHGSMPSYAPVAANVPRNALPSLLGGTPPANLTPRQSAATTVMSLLAHASEEDAAPGAGKFQRATIRRATRDPNFNPYAPENNPAVDPRGHTLQRDLLAGRTSLSATHRETVDDHASDSSGVDEPYYPFRGKNPAWRKRSD
jgi:hypothetical protein